MAIPATLYTRLGWLVSWLRLPGAFIFSLLVVSGGSGLIQAAADEEPPLPAWDAGDTLPPSLSTGNAFGDLLPPDPVPLRSQEMIEQEGLVMPPVLLQEREGLGVQDLPLFLHSRLLENSRAATAEKRSTPTPTLSLKEVPELVRQAVAKAPAAELLIDPQSLLTEVAVQDLERLLAFHSSEARIRLRIVVLERDQTLNSPGLVLAPLERRGVRQQETCIAVYPLGEPWRARFFLSQSVSQHCPLTGLTEMSEDCVAEAMQVSEAEEQLKRFAVRLSTRLFWLEKLLPPTPAPVGSVAEASRAEVSGLREVHPEGGTPAALLGPAEPAASKADLRFVRSAVIGLGCLLAALSATWLVRTLLLWHNRRKRRRVWVLPEGDTVPRLGGAFSGGMGTFVSFRSGPQS